MEDETDWRLQNRSNRKEYTVGLEVKGRTTAEIAWKQENWSKA